MKEIVWERLLSVEVDEIDDDHRKLLNLFNLLTHSLIDEESKNYQAALLQELINCTIWHFSHEERLMLKYGYEEIEQHRAIHRELVKSAREFQNRVVRANKSISEEDVVFLEHWLTEHILTEDMRLGAYLSQVM